MRRRSTLILCLLVAGACTTIRAQTASATDGLSWSTDAPTQRFVAVHGRRSLVMGYPREGLEVWAYPFQLISNYHVSFKPDDDTHTLRGVDLLRRIEYRTDSIIRTYVGADFVVRETLFVPNDAPGAILTYEVEGKPQVTIEASFLPSLNLMWPGALGGQDINWDAGINGFVLSEPLHHNVATISSPEAVAHSSLVNRTLRESEDRSLILEPRIAASGHSTATIYVAYDAPLTPPGATAGDLRTKDSTLRAEAAARYRNLLSTSMRIETPDPEVNRTLDWATIALDQAWVCNPSLGCGELAGYGPSRPGRRPQYAWFFAGDGLVATDAWTATGAFDRARDELAFILKFQNPENGMIWHEISQGVDLADWRRDYPYMYVHVDITFQFLATMLRYIEASGDVAFLRAHGAAVEAALRYCQSVIDPGTALPIIPPGREGANEQDRMRDDLSLSSAWITAAEAAARMEQLLGNTSQAEAATRAAEAARQSVARLDWDPSTRFWLAGHTAAGEPMHTFRPGPVELLAQHVFTQPQTDQALEKLTSPDFQTDWGVRNLSVSSPGYNPSAYGGGSVSALGTASLAEGLWSRHWNLPALALWEALLPWITLDSEGHLHELLAGDMYHPEIESVPEQTWSTAGFLGATAGGLLGLHVDSQHRELTFAPHLVPQWPFVALRNLRVGNTLVDLRVRYSDGSMEVDVANPGAPLTLHLHPELPLGADHLHAAVNSNNSKPRGTEVGRDTDANASYAALTFTVPPGHTHCRIGYRGGVEILQPFANPAVGDSSRDLHLGAVRWQDKTLNLEAFVHDSDHATLTLQTDWSPQAVDGASLRQVAPHRYALTFDPPAAGQPAASGGYAPRKVTVTFGSH